MANCKNCGREIEDDKEICEECEKGVEAEKEEPAEEAEKKEEKKEDNDTLAIVCYLGILFFVPIAIDKDNEFYRYHTNQGLVLFLALIILSAVLVPLFSLLKLYVLGSSLVSVFWLVYFILGVVNVCSHKKEPLPLIGKITIIK